MSIDDRYVSKNSFTYIWQQIVSKFVKKEVFNKKIEEIQDNVKDLANADEVYIMTANDTESDIPDNTVIAIFPDEDAEEVDWTNYYTKPEIDEIIIRADFKKGKSAYEVAVEKGFEGTEEEWLLSLKGKNAYEIACELGFEGTLEEWLETLKGYTPQKGVDYFDGYTPQKNVDYFDGYTPQKDVDYTDGYTPQRGVDYWTETDVSSIQNYVDYLLSELVDSAPETLNTLWELANALGNDPNFATTVANEIGKRVEKIEGKGLSSNDYTDAEKTKLASLTKKFSELEGIPTKLSDFNNDQGFMKRSEVEAMFTQFAKDYLGDYKWRVSNTAGDGYVTVKKG